MTFVVVAIGGAIGSVCRFALATWVQRWTSPFFPYGTFTVNVLGCLCFGVIMGAAQQRFVLTPTARAFALVGILGGFTTFSTLTYETFALLQDGEIGRACLNVAGQVVVGLVALWAGYAVIEAL